MVPGRGGERIQLLRPIPVICAHRNLGCQFDAGCALIALSCSTRRDTGRVFPALKYERWPPDQTPVIDAAYVALLSARTENAWCAQGSQYVFRGSLQLCAATALRPGGRPQKAPLASQVTTQIAASLLLVPYHGNPHRPPSRTSTRTPFRKVWRTFTGSSSSSVGLFESNRQAARRASSSAAASDVRAVKVLRGSSPTTTTRVDAAASGSASGR